MHGERQALAQVTEDDLEARVGIEHAGKDDAQKMAAGVDRKTPRRSLQLFVRRKVSLDCVRVRHRRMQVDRNAELLRGLKDHPEFLVVEERALGVAMDHGALEPELGHAAFELLRCGPRVGRRQCREPGEPIRVLGNRRGENVVSVARHWDRDVRCKALRTGLTKRKYLYVDAGRIHVAQPLLAEIADLLGDIVADMLAAARDPELAEVGGGRVLAQQRRDEMLFDGDDARRFTSSEIVGHWKDYPGPTSTGRASSSVHSDIEPS